MSVSTSPPPASPGIRHRSRPSFAIGYSQPFPLRMSTSGARTHGGPVGPDPKSSTGASFIRAKRHSSPQSAVPTTTAPLNTNQVVNPPHSKHFVAPAHPQSHHLHTLPPREKTTRTLILDHTAWRQGRTRLAQGRCELGMAVRFKNEEHADNSSELNDKGSGFYIGSVGGSSSRRVSDFGEPPEIELASSDEDGDGGDVKESDGESVRPLVYGKHYKRTGRRRKQGTIGHDRMEVDSESEPNSGSDSEVEPSAGSSTTQPQDPSLAPSLAARATGIEKVLRSMLAQPPSSPPRSPSPPPYALHSSHANSQHYRAPPSAQRSSPPPSENPVRVLPNGLRLRLALLALVNDLFERQPPPCQHPSSSAAEDGSSTGASSSDSKQITGQSSMSSPPPLPPPSLPSSNTHTLPSELAMLAQISSQQFNATPTLPSFQTLTMPSTVNSAHTPSTVISPISGDGYGISSTQTGSSSSTQSQSRIASGSGKDSIETGQISGQQVIRPPPPLFSWTRPGATPASPSSPLPSSPSSATPFGIPTHDKDSERVHSITPTSQSLPRLPSSWSSWKRGAPTEQPDKSASIPTSNPGLTRRARGRSRDLYVVGCNTKTSRGTSHSQASSFRTNVPVYSLGTAPAPEPAPAAGFPLKKLKHLCPRHLREQCKICTSSAVTRGGPSTRIGAGLLKKQGHFLSGEPHRDDAIRQSGCVLADLIPRFLRLSALVAMELGREARGEEPEANDGHLDNDSSDGHSAASPIILNVRTSYHAQPTRAWFSMLCGLLTRAVLEGYVARDWKGAEYAEIILGVGLGIKGVGTRRSMAGSGTARMAAADIPTVDDHEDELEPDEMPQLIDAARVLFSGLVQDASILPGSRDKATRSAEEEYVMEMEGRMSEFLTIPHSTPDLATHLTQLSEKYPAEPVERAALRFCEAVAKWRGKPELEMYKKLQVWSKTRSESSTPALLSIDALLTTTPTPIPHRPPINKYFRVLPISSRGELLQPFRPLKRQRSVDEEERELKRERVEVMDVDFVRTDGRDGAVQDDNEWVGPYGL